MASITLHHSDVLGRSGGKQKHKNLDREDDNKTVITTASAVTVRRSNVSGSAMADNVDFILNHLGRLIVGYFFRDGSICRFVRGRASEIGRPLGDISDEEINRLAQTFLEQQPQPQPQPQPRPHPRPQPPHPEPQQPHPEPQQPPPQQRPPGDVLILDGDVPSDLSSLRSGGASSVSRAGPSNTMTRLGDSLLSTSTVYTDPYSGSTADASRQAAEAHLKNDGLFDRGIFDEEIVRNFEPQHMAPANEDSAAAAAASPGEQGHQQRQLQQADHSSVNAHDELSCDSHVGNDQNIGDTVADNNTGQEDEKDDKKPGATKKPRLK